MDMSMDSSSLQDDSVAESQDSGPTALSTEVLQVLGDAETPTQSYQLQPEDVENFMKDGLEYKVERLERHAGETAPLQPQPLSKSGWDANIPGNDIFREPHELVNAVESEQSQPGEQHWYPDATQIIESHRANGQVEGEHEIQPASAQNLFKTTATPDNNLGRPYPHGYENSREGMLENGTLTSSPKSPYAKRARSEAASPEPEPEPEPEAPQSPSISIESLEATLSTLEAFHVPTVEEITALATVYETLVMNDSLRKLHDMLREAIQILNDKAATDGSEGNEAVPQQIAAVEAKRKTLEQVWPDQLEEHRQRLEAEVERRRRILAAPAKEGEHLTQPGVLSELLESIDSRDIFEDDVAQALEGLADHFVEELIEQACAIARLRPDKELQASDVSLAAARIWQVPLPLEDNGEAAAVRQPPLVFNEHVRRRLNMIRQAGPSGLLQLNFRHL